MNKKLRERFDEKISKVPTAQGCLEWTASRNKQGYGIFHRSIRGKGQAHRVAYESHYNVKLTSSQQVNHTCDNPSCVNVQHLRLGTHQTNADDMVKRGRSAVGSKNAAAKLTEGQVKTMKLLYSTGKFSHPALGRFFGVVGTACSHIVRGKNWGHVKMPKLSKEELDTLVSEYIDRGLKPKKRSL